MMDGIGDNITIGQRRISFERFVKFVDDCFNDLKSFLLLIAFYVTKVSSILLFLTCDSLLLVLHMDIILQLYVAAEISHKDRQTVAIDKVVTIIIFPSIVIFFWSIIIWNIVLCSFDLFYIFWKLKLDKPSPSGKKYLPI